jgi:hypothetical protein
MPPLKRGALGDTLKQARAELDGIRQRKESGHHSYEEESFHAISSSLVDQGKFADLDIVGSGA